MPCSKPLLRRANPPRSFGYAFAFEGVARWLAMQLSDGLRSARHIVKSSTQITRDLKLLSPSAADRLITIDVKHFFMSGSKDQLIAAAMKIFHRSPRSELIKRAIEFVLNWQFIKTAADPDSLWQIVTGTGMGLVHSSELADAAFHGIAELGHLTPAKLQGASIKYICRFRDDILAVYDDPIKFSHWYNILKEKSAFFQLEVSCVSRVALRYLDLMITKRGNIWATTPFFKPIEGRPPLDPSSCHPHSVHVFWPRQELKRFRRISSTHADFLAASKEFMERFTYHHLPVPTLPRLEVSRPSKITSLVSSVPALRTVGNNSCMWIPIGFHPSLVKAGVARAIRSAVSDPQFQALYRVAFGNHLPFCARLCWYNRLKNVVGHVK
jgi:hypothetical protein